MKLPLFISDPSYCRKIFLPFKEKIIDKKIKSILAVNAERKGGFNRSHKIRYKVLAEKINGEKIKLAFWGLSSPNPTRLQSFRVMDYLWKNDFSSGDYSISKPIAYLKKHSMVITQEIKGQPFFNILETHSLPKISLVLKKSARWLKKLHKTPVYSFNDIFPFYRKMYWKEQFRVLKMGFPKKSEILKKIIKEIIYWEENNEESKNRVIVHHDFQPKNIFLEKGKILVLDFSESRLSRSIVDIFTFLIQLELMNNFLKKPFSKNEIRNFAKVFLNEYFGKQWQNVLKNLNFRRDFIILRKRVACQALVGTIILKRKPKIFSKILFGKSKNLFF